MFGWNLKLLHFSLITQQDILWKKKYIHIIYITAQNYVRSSKMVKQSHYRPGQALRVPGDWGSQISRQSSHEGCQLYAPAAFIPRIYSWYSFLLEAESTPRPRCGQKDCANEKFQWHHRESNPRPSGLWHSASTNCATVCPMSDQAESTR